MSAKEIVQEFYKYDVMLETETVKHFLHPDVMLEWHTTHGFRVLTLDDIIALSIEMSKSYVRSKTRINHIVAEGDTVAIRYSHYAKTIENPREEMLLAHFMVIWELKDTKLYRGYQMSQL
jgi:predicted SnoaL-like aldol condensation-catalyzing enzyme